MRTTWDMKIIGHKFPVIVGDDGIKLDPSMVPENILGEWEIDMDENIFRLAQLSEFRPVSLVVEVTTDNEFKIESINLDNSYGFHSCGGGRPYDIDVQLREFNQIGRILKGMVGMK